MSGMAEVARGSLAAGRSPSASMSAENAAISSIGQVEVINTELACLAQYVVVDVGHVADKPGLVTRGRAAAAG